VKLVLLHPISNTLRTEYPIHGNIATDETLVTKVAIGRPLIFSERKIKNKMKNRYPTANLVVIIHDSGIAPLYHIDGPKKWKKDAK